MAQVEIQSEKQQGQGKHCGDVLSRGECAKCEEQLIPPGLSSDSLRNLLDISPAGQREVLRQRRFLAKMQQEFQTLGLPGQEAAKEFILHLYRRNCRSSTLRAYFGTIHRFLTCLHRTGRTHREALTREDLEAFLEHEHDRSLKPSTVRTRVALVNALIRFLVRREVMRPEGLSRSITITVPELVPKALEPEDVTRLVAVVSTVRDRALILVLLRTGMRLGELFSTTMSDLKLQERKILIFQAEKTQGGRVVYLSDDAQPALLAWLAERDPHQQQLFMVKADTACRIPRCAPGSTSTWTRPGFPRQATLSTA